MTTAYPHNPTPQQTDPTMRALMEVHRAQVNQLERELGQQKSSYDSMYNSAQERERRLAQDLKRAKDAEENQKQRVAERDKQIADLTETEVRLRDKVQSLQIELQTEREAHTGMRDAAHTTPEDEQ